MIFKIEAEMSKVVVEVKSITYAKWTKFLEDLDTIKISTWPDIESGIIISELIAEAGLGVASLLKIEGESSARLDGSSLPPLVVEGYILVFGSLKFFIMISRYISQVTQRIELCSPATAPENSLDNPQV